MKPDKNNFAPRLGVVYSSTTRRCCAAATGIFYNLFDRVGSEDQLALNVPGLINNNVTQTPARRSFFLRRTGIPADFLTPANLDPAAGQLRALRIRAVTEGRAQDDDPPGERRLPARAAADLSLTADGVCTKGTNLATLVNLNQPLPNAAGNDALGALPYPNFGFIEWRAQDGGSEYKGVDVGVEKRFSEGYGFRRRRIRSPTRRTTPRNSSPPRARTPSRRTPATSAPGTGRATTTCATAWPSNFVAELPFGGKKWARRRDPGMDDLRHLRRALGPAVHGEPEQQQRRPEHDRPAQPGRRPRRP